MTGLEQEAGRWRRVWVPAMLAVLGLAALVSAMGGLWRNDRAEAIASCVSHTNTAEEMDFLGQLQAWRDDHIAGSHQLIRSGALNAAAAGYAQFLADHPGAGGHYADGSDFSTRAMNCDFSSTHPGDGYPYPAAAGGEGLAVVESSAAITVSASQALATMASESGGGIWVPASVGPPVICVGVAKAVNASGTKVAWVAELFGSTSGTCPDADPPAADPSGTATPSATSSATTSTATASASASPTATQTASPTPTATATPTPETYRAFAPMIARDN